MIMSQAIILKLVSIDRRHKVLFTNKYINKCGICIPNSTTEVVDDC